MATLKDLTDLMASSNLTEAQIADLISTLTVMQKENKVSKRGKKVILSAELLELLEKWQTEIFVQGLLQNLWRYLWRAALPLKIVGGPMETIPDFNPLQLQYQSEQD